MNNFGEFGSIFKASFCRRRKKRPPSTGFPNSFCNDSVEVGLFSQKNYSTHRLRELGKEAISSNQHNPD